MLKKNPVSIFNIFFYSCTYICRCTVLIHVSKCKLWYKYAARPVSLHCLQLPERSVLCSLLQMQEGNGLGKQHITRASDAKKRLAAFVLFGIYVPEAVTA